MPSDFEQIQTLLARYCFVTDTGSAEDMAALFWDDCTVNFDGTINQGLDAATKGFARWIEKRRDPIVGLRHLLHTPEISIDGNRASARCYYDADCHTKAGRPIQLRGIYIDTLEKRDGAWRFLTREVQIWQSMLEKP